MIPVLRVPHPLLRTLGLAIRSLRRDRGLSQETLAALADIDRSYMSSIERGLRNVSVLNVARIAAALGVPVWQLFRPQAVRSPIAGRAMEPHDPMPLSGPTAVPQVPSADHAARDWEPRYLSLG
jgi:transcriptional regulator with XRE-family HTH domain